MRILIVVDDPADWPLEIPEVEVISARSYLIDPKYGDLRGIRIFNLCKSYRYQTLGYYVSLLAAARNHKPLPSISTIQDMKSVTIVRLASDDLEDLIQESLAPIRSKYFTLSIYFGRNLTQRYDRLCHHLFAQFQAPFIRAIFRKDEDTWELSQVGAIPASEVPDSHHDFVVEVAREYFAGRRFGIPKKTQPRYSVAILHNPEEKLPPSNTKALEKFEKAAEALDMEVEMLTKDDYSRIAEYDALFIRETTAVNHHTYRFARRAEAEGLVVVDDPQSIVRCANKVYLAELLDHHKIPAPRTLIVHQDNVGDIVKEVGLPCVLKQPDSAFSLGVKKVETEDELKEAVDHLLEHSDLILAQEFLPTDFDWRIGVFDRQPLFVCKYFMARKHWQIIKREDDGDTDYGRVQTMPVELAPRAVVKIALRTANLIGDGLYGVDVKQVGNKFYIIEVNDNPNIDSGFEDSVLKDELYWRIMHVFLKRLDKRKEGNRYA